MRNADIVLDIHHKRGTKGLPLERVYKHLFNPQLYLRAYGKIYRNAGAMTKGVTDETVDGMSLQKIQRIIELLRKEQYQWSPARRKEIPKANGKTRPLGISSWSDKLLQEVIRILLEPYYEPQFSQRSHGFRPRKGTHTALKEVQQWDGTIWFIEGDIHACFDEIDFQTLLDILRKDLHDGRLIRLIEGLLKAGYMEGWQRKETDRGVPQGSILSPLLANVYLNQLDQFVEHSLIPAYTSGQRRRGNPAYRRLERRIADARKDGDWERCRTLVRERRQLPSIDPQDPNFRRLRYVRYADDFLLGFAGPKSEAEEIRRRLGNFLREELKLQLSTEKTLITHAVGGKARFLGYEITASRCDSQLSPTKGTRVRKRIANGRIALLMPKKAVQDVRQCYSKGRKVVRRTELKNDSDYTIVQRYQGILRGLYNYYCMAMNVSKRMGQIRWILETSLTKTLARKHKCRVHQIYRKYQTTKAGYKVIQVTIPRAEKEPLIATFGGFPLARKPEGMIHVVFDPDRAWFQPGWDRAEAIDQLLAGQCELCGAKDVPIEMHHIRKLADLNRPGQKSRPKWVEYMASRKRKKIPVCQECHRQIHEGKYDGPRLG